MKEIVFDMDVSVTVCNFAASNIFLSFLLHFCFDWDRIIPSLTVSKRKNRCIPCIYWGAAIFAVVTKYSNLFPSFTFFLDRSHFTFGYVLIIGSKATGLMKIIRDSFPFI